MPDIKSGDWVEYVDTDQTHWGPWKVVEVRECQVKVRIEGIFTDVLPRHRTRKVDEQQEG